MSKVLSVRALSWSYKNRGRVLREVSFELEKGRILALFGPNGSGKSTLLKLIAGVLPLESAEGVVSCSGVDIRSLGPRERARKIAYVPAEVGLDFPLKAIEAVELGRSSLGLGLIGARDAEGNSRLRLAMENCDCWHLRDRWMHELSSGERQLVHLARAVALDSPVLLLDEAMSRMDLHHQAMVGKLLRRLAREDRSIILVSHDVSLATELADAALLLKSGETIAQGLIDETVTSENFAKLYPGAALEVFLSPKSGKPRVHFN